MSFFARPNLSDLEMKQLIGTQLTLSGQTRIATTSGLTLTDGVGGFIPIVATGATIGSVLTYNGNKIVLISSSGTSGGLYSGASPTTISVGGLISGSSIASQSISSIIESIVAPVLNPSLINPSEIFSISPLNTLYEVGTNINITGCTVFSRGSVSPAYCGGTNVRSGLPTYYEYNVWGTPTCAISTFTTNTICFGSHPVTVGNNTLSSKVWYSCGAQPLNSSGGNYSTPLPSGSSNTSAITISGIYPYFYGNVTCAVQSGCNRPAATAGLITSGTKVAQPSTGTICINFNSTDTQYVWFAIPSTSPSKCIWYVDPINTGVIGGSASAGGNLFPNYNTVNSVTTTFWSGISYKLYISNYQTAINTIIELRNS